MLQIRKYTHHDADDWNDFNLKSKNGLFLFDRRYMDYHSDRFTDHSLILTRDDKIEALLPANRSEDAVFSHQGLTFGGWITNESMRCETMLEAMTLMTEFLRREGIKRIDYKPIPTIFHRQPAQEDMYALFRIGATISRVDASTVINLRNAITPNKGRRAASVKASRMGVEIRHDGELEEFLEILSSRLDEKYRTKATHTFAEMDLLRRRFPDQIQLRTAHKDGQMLSGALLFIFDNVVHTQYLASTSEGMRMGSNDLNIMTIIKEFTEKKDFFSFGISTEAAGTYLNTGLIAQKEHFGGRTTVNQFYTATL